MYTSRCYGSVRSLVEVPLQYSIITISFWLSTILH